MNGPTPPRPEFKLDILGRLLLVQQMIEAMPDERRVGEFVVRSLRDLPGVSEVRMCLRGYAVPPDARLDALAAKCEEFFAAPGMIDCAAILDEPGVRALPLRAADHLFGALALTIDDETAFAPYADFHANIANAVAMTLEARHCQLQLAQSAERLAAAHATLEHQERALYRLAHYDRSTGLLTHGAFVERLGDAIASASDDHVPGEKRDAPRAAIVAITVQHWGRLTESISYRESGELLQSIADRLRQAVRHEDIVARERGERFYVGALLNGKSDDTSDAKTDSLEFQIAAIAEALSPPYLVGGQRRVLRFGIGIALYPSDGDDIEALMLRAEGATHVGADLPRDKLPVFYSSDLSERSRRRQAIEDGLVDAAENGEFRFAFQPKFDAPGKRLLGCEALLRWRSPALGEIMPGEFIPIAEETGVIAEIGGWVATAACRQIGAWLADGLVVPPIGINVSMRQMLSPTAVRTVLDAPAAAGVPPELIEIEITESAAMQDVRATCAFLHDLHERGMSCTLDDFGTGYSSLAYLFDLPFDALKIDKRFVDRLDSHKGRALVRSIVAMAHEIGLHVVAEGVEQQGQADLLTVWGCNAIQGFLYSRPLEAEAMAVLLHDKAASPPRRAARAKGRPRSER
ncbi:MAG: putative bifunctional diguanylate cyclase/phosphodiesterase [Alphaproteobacteria bacterium]